MESDTELGSTPMAPTEAATSGQDRLVDDSIDQQDASEHGVGKKRKVFPYHITNELRSLYKAGMIGVGVQYSNLIDAACDRTGLSKSQVKSWIKRTKYHHRRALKQDEERDREYHNTEDDPPMSYIDQPLINESNHVTNHVTTTLYTQEPIVSLPNEPLVVLDDDRMRGGATATPTTVEGVHMRKPHVLVRDPTTGNDNMMGGASVDNRLRVAVHHPEDNIREAVHITSVRDTRQQAAGEVYTHTTLPTITVPVTTIQPPPALVVQGNGTAHHHQAPQRLTKEQVTQEASRLFRKIERSYRRLDELGYQGFAFGFKEEDTQLVYSGSIGHCFTQPLIAYFKALIVAANPPPLIPHIVQPTTLIRTTNATNHTHIIPAAGTSTPSSRQQLYMYEPNPTRVQQRTAIYELSDPEGLEENGQTTEIEAGLRRGTFLGPNGKTVHVVLAHDPNITDMEGELSD